MPPFRRLHIRQWADFPELLLAPGPSQSLEEHGGPFLIGAFASWVEKWETIFSHHFALMQHTNLQIQDLTENGSSPFWGRQSRQASFHRLVSLKPLGSKAPPTLFLADGWQSQHSF